MERKESKRKMDANESMYMNMNIKMEQVSRCEALQNSYYPCILTLLYTIIRLGSDDHGVAQWLQDVDVVFTAVVTYSR
jgi:hypothetical protein